MCPLSLRWLRLGAITQELRAAFRDLQHSFQDIRFAQRAGETLPNLMGTRQALERVIGRDSFHVRASNRFVAHRVNCDERTVEAASEKQGDKPVPSFVPCFVRRQDERRVSCTRSLFKGVRVSPQRW